MFQMSFADREKQRVVDFLTDHLKGADPQPEAFAELLFTAAEQDSRFCMVLRQWLNGSRRYTDFSVNDHALLDLADFYEDEKLGVLVALRLLWDEQNGMTDICLTIGQGCIADTGIVLHGERTEVAIPEVNGWYFYSKKFTQSQPFETGGYDLYRVCEADPALIELVTEEDMPYGRCYVCRTGDTDFELFIEEDDRTPDHANSKEG